MTFVTVPICPLVFSSRYKDSVSAKDLPLVSRKHSLDCALDDRHSVRLLNTSPDQFTRRYINGRAMPSAANVPRWMSEGCAQLVRSESQGADRS